MELTMAEASNENIAKSCENPKENGKKMKEGHKAKSLPNGKHNGDSVKNGMAEENPKPIISQKSTPTQSHKSLHTSTHSSSCTIEASSSNINHVASKSESKSKFDSKNSSETPSKDKKRKDEHGKNKLLAFYGPAKSGTCMSSETILMTHYNSLLLT
jgi:hypothetical protein